MSGWTKLLAAVSGGLLFGVASYYAFAALYTAKKRKRRPSFGSGKNGVNGSGETRRIIVLGLFAAGKSSVISRLSKVDKEKRQVNPTEGFNVLCLQSAGVTYNIWEVGGRMKSFWTNFIEETDLLVFVVDSSAADDQLDEAVSEFNRLLSDQRLTLTPVLLLANKQDLSGAKSPEEIESRFGCHGGSVRDHPVRCLGSRAPADVPAHPSIWEAERLMLTLCHNSN